MIQFESLPTTLFRTTCALVLAAALSACGQRDVPPPAAVLGGEVPVAQSFEIVIDGQVHRMEPDNPRKGHLVSASLVKGQRLSLSAMNQAADFSFVATLEPEGNKALTPGTHPSFTCISSSACDEGQREGAPPESMLVPFPTDTPAEPAKIRFAYKAPELGLEPLTVTLDKLEDTYWPGVGPAKRIKGTFKGRLAHLEGDNQKTPTIVGPVRQVEGKFDLYAMIR